MRHWLIVSGVALSLALVVVLFLVWRHQVELGKRRDWRDLNAPEVVEARGWVEIKSVTGETRLAAKGEVVGMGETIVTGPSGGARLRYLDGGESDLDSGTSLLVTPSSYADYTAGKRQRCVELHRGMIDCRIPSPGVDTTVVTGQARCRVAGRLSATAFFLNGIDNFSFLRVDEGEVLFQAKSELEAMVVEAGRNAVATAESARRIVFAENEISLDPLKQWSVVKDDKARGSVSIVPSGVGDGQCLKLSYQLKDDPDGWWAYAGRRWTPRMRFKDYDGISFWCRGDGDNRFLFDIREQMGRYKVVTFERNFDNDFSGWRQLLIPWDLLRFKHQHGLDETGKKKSDWKLGLQGGGDLFFGTFYGDVLNGSLEIRGIRLFKAVKAGAEGRTEKEGKGEG